MKTNLRRLRKYARKKRLASRSLNPKAEHYRLLYWRYWFKVFGRHSRIWP